MVLPSTKTIRRIAVVLVGLGLLAIVANFCWIAANSPDKSWFGAISSHGDRAQSTVALTFDDGPDSHWTLKVNDVLDRYGVKATFFTVGKALQRHPEVSRALLADGQIVANHSYEHDQWRWLDPRYPELGRAQAVFKQQLGVCPAFYRPPHGQHTPFVSRVVHNAGMQMVGWEVSAGDWATNDPALVARRVLRKVKPGSIILLHDGLDGLDRADRSVVVEALPMILDGLKAKGLQVVPLDQLLGQPAYLDHC